MSILHGYAKTDGALMVERRFHDPEIEPWEIARWLEEHLGPEYCLDLIGSLQSRPSVKKLMEEEEATK